MPRWHQQPEGPSASPPENPLVCACAKTRSDRPYVGLSHLSSQLLRPQAFLPRIHRCVLTPRCSEPPRRSHLGYNFAIYSSLAKTIPPVGSRAVAPPRSLSGKSVTDLQPKRVPRRVAPLHGIWVAFLSVCRTDWHKRIVVLPPVEVVTTHG